MIIAGLGSRKGVEASEVVALIERALEAASLSRADLTALATIEAKAEEPGLAAAAISLGLKLVPMEQSAMQAAEQRVASQPAAPRMFGVSSVSEAAALAAAGAGSELILARIKSARATCALARSRGATV